MSYIADECKMLAQKYYKCWRHDKVAQVINPLAILWKIELRTGEKVVQPYT